MKRHEIHRTIIIKPPGIVKKDTMTALEALWKAIIRNVT